ncbi:MAG: triose-phosphate isomerase [Candidatus Caldatribacteriota bacterium]|jgi:triosephosphate isomerase|nr:triose-phosphate isomerase [Atribacterota bacterium]MDD3032012.1 triose-phosphate isomerase [Atribacterota bacterium]MDD4288203.1 triose-phosphate isomerase [Atribacterota bacterium]MDD4764420.1 triose-phosphate isomerase [Atribacterota bacterium]MDI9596733.1 triose-phosphate isomerase [Atribacterota bacterium]
MRKPLIAGNWKMNKTITESISLVKELVDFVKEYQKTEIVICPPFTSLWVTREIIQDTNILLGAQNMYFQNEGAYTGEISANMLKNIGCDYVILGHSERREYFNESSQEVARKVGKALSSGIKPIICVGEKLEERESGTAKDIVREQVEAIFEILKPEDAEKVVFAYEPIWAIGTGKSATSQDANDMIKYIRCIWKQRYDENTAEKIRILYGGSVKPENTKELMVESDIDGALVGGASLKALSFSEIVKYAE